MVITIFILCINNINQDIKDFIKKNRNSHCLNQFFGKRIFHRGDVYFVNIPKYNNYLLAFYYTNNQINLLEKATSYYNDTNISINSNKPISKELFNEVIKDTESIRTLVNCFKSFHIKYVNSPQNENIIEFIINDENILYYIPNIYIIDSKKNDWIMNNTIKIENQWYWIYRKSIMNSIWKQ